MKTKKVVRFLFFKLPVAFITISVLWVLVLKWVPVWVTPLMLSRSIEYRKDDSFKTRKDWVKLEDMSADLVKAVIASEDNLFCEHNGFDWDQMRKAIDEHKIKGKKLRGASTISQQTAKNVFLFPSRSFVRKGFEAYFTILIELFWSKERIMEVYLNVAEMGKGVYGAQAASKVHFGKDAIQLTRWQSCLIAASLPNPLKRNPAAPSAYVCKRASQINNLIPKLAYSEWI